MSSIIDNNLPLIGREIPYKLIDKEVLKVENFGQLSRVENGKVQALAKNLPYGFLEVKSSVFKGKAMLLLIHKEDYLHVWQASEQRGIADNEELLVVWTNTNYKSKLISAMSKAMPKIIVWISPKDSFKLMHDQEFRPELVGGERLLAYSFIKEIKPDVMN